MTVNPTSITPETHYKAVLDLQQQGQERERRQDDKRTASELRIMKHIDVYSDKVEDRLDDQQRQIDRLGNWSKAIGAAVTATLTWLGFRAAGG
jgi:hypothetical protein